jgi:hypothetical protein
LENPKNSTSLLCHSCNFSKKKASDPTARLESIWKKNSRRILDFKAFLKQKKSDLSFNTNALRSSGDYSGLDPMLSKVDLLKKLQKLLVVEFRMSSTRSS